MNLWTKGLARAKMLWPSRVLWLATTADMAARHVMGTDTRGLSTQVKNLYIFRPI